MSILYKFFLFFTLVIFNINFLFGAPTDFNSDGISDFASIKATNPLSWDTERGPSTFGSLGDHLASGDYNKNNKTNKAVITSNGTWKSPLGEFNFGDLTSLFISGADFDGDNGDDALIIDQNCRNGRKQAYYRLNPFDSAASNTSIKVGTKGSFYSYADVNSDGRDDLCWSRALKTQKEYNTKFLIKCIDVITNQKLASFRVPKLEGQFFPIKLDNNAPDLFAIPVRNKVRKKYLIKNINGSTISSIMFRGNGIITVGNYSNLPGEEIAFTNKDEKIIFNPLSNYIYKTAGSEDIVFDDININSFKKLNCLCTSSKIKKYKGCKKIVETTPTNPTPTQGNGQTCQRYEGITDGPGNWLHKPVSESTGSVVNLFNPNSRPTRCNYLDSNFNVFKSAYFSGDTNPDRPTWRPNGGGHCSSYPKPLIVSCDISGVNTCFNIPDPCVRYD